MKVEELIREKNLKVTKHRKIILETIEKSPSPLSAEEIHDALNESEAMDLSTVYRNLNILDQNDVLLKTQDNSGISFYQLNNSNHKHFISCQVCNKKITIESCPVHELEESIESETGFVITGHSFEFTGICPNCKNQI